MQSIREFNLVSLKNARRFEYESDNVTGERKNNKSLFCIPIKTKKIEKKTILEIGSPYDFKHVTHIGDSYNVIEHLEVYLPYSFYFSSFLNF